MLVDKYGHAHSTRVLQDWSAELLRAMGIVPPTEGDAHSNPTPGFRDNLPTMKVAKPAQNRSPKIDQTVRQTNETQEVSCVQRKADAPGKRAGSNLIRPKPHDKAKPQNLK